MSTRIRAAADGDYAVVSLETIGGVEGEPIRNEACRCTSEIPKRLAEFTENLQGMSPTRKRRNSSVIIRRLWPGTAGGKRCPFPGDRKGVRRRELPELNDEFARDLGDYQTLDELRDTVRSSIRAEREFAAQQESKNKDRRPAGRCAPVPDPEAFLDRQIEVQVERQLRELAGQGVDPRQIKLDWEKLKESRRERRQQSDVRASLLLERIADAESIYATNEEVDRELNSSPNASVNRLHRCA